MLEDYFGLLEPAQDDLMLILRIEKTSEIDTGVLRTWSCVVKKFLEVWKLKSEDWVSKDRGCLGF